MSISVGDVFQYLDAYDLIICDYEIMSISKLGMITADRLPDRLKNLAFSPGLENSPGFRGWVSKSQGTLPTVAHPPYPTATPHVTATEVLRKLNYRSYNLHPDDFHFHSWKNYVGFTETYQYCESCDEKREWKPGKDCA